MSDEAQPNDFDSDLETLRSEIEDADGQEIVDLRARRLLKQYRDADEYETPEAKQKREKEGGTLKSEAYLRRMLAALPPNTRDKFLLAARRFNKPRAISGWICTAVGGLGVAAVLLALTQIPSYSSGDQQRALFFTGVPWLVLLIVGIWLLSQRRLRDMV